ncbi:hypothetical protein R1flu_010229 [Riccia fluitans]|uniref:Uncharacterized protein n=1 Tax=Riccia fluitans TaxID=41844 RepID=A0ABD1Z4D3_9MARC
MADHHSAKLEARPIGKPFGGSPMINRAFTSADANLRRPENCSCLSPTNRARVLPSAADSSKLKAETSVPFINEAPHSDSSTAASCSSPIKPVYGGKAGKVSSGSVETKTPRRGSEREPFLCSHDPLQSKNKCPKGAAVSVAEDEEDPSKENRDPNPNHLIDEC